MPNPKTNLIQRRRNSLLLSTDVILGPHRRKAPFSAQTLSWPPAALTTTFSHHSPPPAPLYRLKGLNEGNLISHVRECTRWLTCLWRTFRDWADIMLSDTCWHQHCSHRYSFHVWILLLGKSGKEKTVHFVYLEVRQSIKPGKIRGEDGRDFLQPTLFSSSAVSNITWHDHRSVFRVTQPLIVISASLYSPNTAHSYVSG